MFLEHTVFSNLIVLGSYEAPMTTTLDIYTDILQRLLEAGAVVCVNTTMELEEYTTDTGGGVSVSEAGPSAVSFRLWERIEADEKGVVIADEQTIDDIDEALFELSISPFETNITTFCSLVTELADAGHMIQVKINGEKVRILEIEPLEIGKFKALYLSLDEEKNVVSHEIGDEDPDYYQVTDDLSFLSDFYASYNEEEARYRLFPLDFDTTQEDAYELYERLFLPRMQAARANGEIPGLIYHD